MNQHKNILAEIARQYAAMADAVAVSPTALAHGVFEAFSAESVEIHIQYGFLEHVKHMARKFLAERAEPDSDDSEAYQTSVDFGQQFSGQLQDRYPVPRAKGEEPAYKLRRALSREERAWNAAMLRKTGKARLEHADALEAEGMAADAIDAEAMAAE